MRQTIFNHQFALYISMTSPEHFSAASSLDDQLEVAFCLSSNGERVRNQNFSSRNKKTDPEKTLTSNYLGPWGIPMQCKRASIELKARAFLLHLKRELHLAFHLCKKTVRGLFQRRCKEGSESPLCMLFALKYSFTARPLEGPFMLRKQCK